LLRAGALRGLGPGPCLEEVNAQLLRDAASDLFVTLFYAVLDSRSGELAYANAGHNPPFVIRAGGAVEELPGRGLMLGALPAARHAARHARLAPGDCLFLYTDGVTEALNAREEMFGVRRLRRALAEAGGAPEEVVGRVVEAVRRFADGAPPSDDLTAL